MSRHWLEKNMSCFPRDFPVSNYHLEMSLIQHPYSTNMYKGHGILAASQSDSFRNTLYQDFSWKTKHCIGSSLHSVYRLAGWARTLPPQLPLSDHLQPVENIMWPVGCAALWKRVSISILGSLYVSICGLRLALHSATWTQLQLKAT